jgi:hypothetical protein
MDSMRAGSILFEGQRLVSDQCNYHLDMQTDGNLVLYAGVGSSELALWYAPRCGRRDVCWGNDTGLPTYAALQTDGNFVDYTDARGVDSPWWASAYGLPGGDPPNEPVLLSMQDDGNLVLYPSAGGSPLWATNTSSAEDGVPAQSPTSPCPFQSKVTYIENDLYLAGIDELYSNFECTNDAMACGQFCASDSWCTGWTWFPSGTNASAAGGGNCPATEGTCFVEQGAKLGAWTEIQGAVSGVILTN